MCIFTVEQTNINQSYYSQLKLALKWDRVDIARDYIFTKDDSKLKPNELNEIMFDALVNDRVDFVQLLLKNNFQLEPFLTYRCLLKLYNKVSRFN